MKTYSPKARSRSIISVLVILFCSQVFGGVVGGKATREGVLSGREFSKFTFEFEKNEDAYIAVVFNPDFDSGTVDCGKFRVKMFVDGDWFMTGGAHWIDQDKFFPKCLVEMGYGYGHPMGKRRRTVTIEVNNDHEKVGTLYTLTTN